MTAIRGARAAEGRFVQLRNAAAQDERLSLEAIGIIYLVLSLPPEQRFTRQWLIDRFAGKNSRPAVDRGLAELEQHGYFHRKPHSAGRGKWEWEQIITDDPAMLTDYQSRSTDMTSGNITSSQVSSVDQDRSDVKRSTKNLKTDHLKTVKHAAPRSAGAAGDAGLQVRGLHPAVTREGAA